MTSLHQIYEEMILLVPFWVHLPSRFEAGISLYFGAIFSYGFDAIPSFLTLILKPKLQILDGNTER